jgi:hypothetical protein
MLDVDCATAAVPCGTVGAVVSGGVGGVTVVEPPEFEQAASVAAIASTVAQ